MQFNITEIRAMIFILWKLEYQPINIYQKLAEALGDDAPSLQTIYNWCRKFKTGIENLKDAPRSGRPSLEIADLYSGKVQKQLAEVPNTSTRELANMCGCSETTMRSALIEDLGYRMLQRRWVPHLLTESQKFERVEFCKYFRNRFRDGNAKSVYNIVTCDESYVHLYTTVRGPQAKMWVLENEDIVDQPRPSKWTQKFMTLIFFSKTGILNADLNIAKHTVDTSYYITSGLEPMIVAWKEKHPKTPLSKLVFYQDNARPHKSAETMGFLEESKIETLSVPGYSPDLAPCDFWLFPKIKGALAGKIFHDLEDVKSAWEAELNKLTQDDFNNCFSSWFKRCQVVVENGRTYI